MDIVRNVVYYSFHPIQLANILQWNISHYPVHPRNTHKTEQQTICFKFLDQTSRSFSVVVQELHPELLFPVCVFYLALRGLDTIEDDPSIPLDTKEPLLRGFRDILETDGWTFDGNRPEEKDRELLVQFHNVITGYKMMKPEYRVIIADIADQMGNGMADFCSSANAEASITTTAEYDLYCVYVAGLVGEGLTRLFAEADLGNGVRFGNSTLLERPQLHKSMGLFLQKTNIIRDVRADNDDNRRFWPKEIWSKHVTKFDDLFKRENREAALNCSAEMILNALDHVNDCLLYLDALQEQSVFNFCAIPQTMAIATLELSFRNPAVFERNIKITRGDACRLMTESTQDMRVLCGTFSRYVRRIQRKNTPEDPNFDRINVNCGKIEKSISSLFVSGNAKDGENKVVS